MINITPRNQWDPRWGSLRIGTLGGQPVTLGSHGCFITVMSMITDLTPDVLLRRLEDVNGLLDDGQLTYDGLMRAVPQAYFHERVYTTNEASDGQKMQVETALARIRRLIRLGQPVGITVDAVANDRRQDHIVLAYENLPDGDFLIVDPAGGIRTKLSLRYGRPENGVMGYVSIIAPTVEYPDDGDPKGGQALQKMAELRRKVEELPSSNVKRDLRFLTRDLIDLFVTPT